MNVHEYDNNMRQDKEFIDGDIGFIVEGNRCRLLDGRRTEGIIEKYFPDSAMFKWRITKYEDQGKCWVLPAEDIKRFQFERNSEKLGGEQVEQIRRKIGKYQQKLVIEAVEEKKNTSEEEIEKGKVSAMKWLSSNSKFIEGGGEIDLSSSQGPELLMEDFKEYMKSEGLGEEERKTSEKMVLNPDSGEWIKGMKIVLAQMGLVSFEGKIPRTKDIFTGLGNRKNRRRYLVTRIAFIRAYFSMLDISQVVVYRGMSSEKKWEDVFRTFLNCTFRLEVGKEFCDFNREGKNKISYLLKMTVPVEKLFMTYLETEAMNRQYKEAEAVLIYDKVLKL